MDSRTAALVCMVRFGVDVVELYSSLFVNCHFYCICIVTVAASM